ncbi:MAG: PH domain-containing protein [Roseimicrobium sp.]
MATPRYFLPDHQTLTEVYTKAELRAMLHQGELSRSDMVTDDETGLSHLLGDLVTISFPQGDMHQLRSTSAFQPLSPSHEFRAHTPLSSRDSPNDETLPDETSADELDLAEPEDESPFAEETDDAMPMHEASALADLSESVEEENFLYVGHPSWFAFPRSLLAMGLGILGAYVFYKEGLGLEWVTFFGSTAGLVLLFVSLERATTSYFITTRRVEIEFGVVGRNTKEVRICDIRAIDVEQKGYAAVVGIGTVKFDSSATSGPEVCFMNVRKPHAIKQLVRELQG